MFQRIGSLYDPPPRCKHHPTLKQHLKEMAQNLRRIADEVGVFLQSVADTRERVDRVVQQMADMEQQIITNAHITQWQMYNAQVEARNSMNHSRVATLQLEARVMNRTFIDSHLPLEPICRPFPWIPTLEMPPPPAPGQPPNPPPHLPPAPQNILGPHALFPATRADLGQLSEPQLGELLVAYGLDIPDTLAQRRAKLYQFIGSPR
ncbi:hypothetical protein DL93DRAFT_2084490 [Clavulina sp. PMI_390]|nr:hypothetical protein DL93DRAFT_2084490 [Clavulina sp. PMI_390]